MNTQTKQKTFKELEHFKAYAEIYTPYYILAIGDDKDDFELKEYDLLQSKINDIYDNINDYKGLPIEIWLVTQQGYVTITVIQREEEE